ncbi:MAG TPA: peptide ABC transporter substrate-binding protein [Gemmatimonadaceae bacterium]|jgi:peptide/nickel transport system substrate-binding protein|nr:peptide ABC transporter substrate-binding protein [Gemmatimonadaceae bacterium]
MRASAPVILTLLVTITSACQQDGPAVRGGEDGGTLVIASGSDATILFPPLTMNVTSAQVEAQIFEHLAEPGEKLNMIGDVGWEGRLAHSWSWGADSLSIAFRLDSMARWQDGPPVRASDVVFTYDLYTDSTVGSLVAPLLAEIDSVTVRDSLTAVFWFSHRSPEQFATAAFQMRILPEHLLSKSDRKQLESSDFARSPVGSGPFRFVRWVPRQVIELEANTNYHLGRPHLDRVIWSIAPDYNAAFMRLLSGDADMLEYLRPGDFEQLSKHPEIKTVRYPSLIYGFLLFNERDPKNQKRPHPIFANRSVRRALTMAIDRVQLARSVYDTLAVPAIGPFTEALSTYDSTIRQIPYDPDSAATLLDAAGWRDADGDGWRERNGVPLRFTMIVPSSSTPRMRAAVIMQEMFKKVGVRAEIEQMDFPTHGSRQEARRFDASMNTMSSDGVPSTIRQLWSTEAAKEGSNYGSYESPRFDALVDSAASQMDPRKAGAYYRQAYQLLADDAPAIWLFEPLSYAAMQQRIHPVGMRANGWWLNLKDWYIPQGERIARDRVGLSRETPAGE